MSQCCVGLFGTGSTSTWRNNFIKKLHDARVDYFVGSSLQVNLHSQTENDYHFALDKVLVFAITGEDYSQAELSEVGFAIASVANSSSVRNVILYIDQNLDPVLNDTARRTDSLTARQLVLSHVHKLWIPSVTIVKSLEEGIDLSIRLARY